MINRKEFDLLLQEIFQIENKIEELKVIKQFNKASRYEEDLKQIRSKAESIVLDDTNTSKGFDKLSLEVLKELICLNTEINYFILKNNNIIESEENNRIDSEVLEQIRRLWENLDLEINSWKETNHNPIEELEFNKKIGKETLKNIIYQLQKEAIIDFSKIFKYCKSEFLINALKEMLFNIAKIKEEKEKNDLVNLAKVVTEKDLYDYKFWQKILLAKGLRSRDDHIEILGNLKDINNKKYITENNSKNTIESNLDEDLIYDETLLNTIKKWFYNLKITMSQKKMGISWLSSNGPAFKVEFEDGTNKFSKDFLDRKTIENAKKIIIATNGISKYNFEENSEWKNLEEIEFVEEKHSSGTNLSPDKTYNCIGNDTFASCKKLKNISFGKIEMIGERAFKDCTSISELVFSKSIINIGEDAFLNCVNLKKVEFLGDLKLYILDRPHNIINCFKGTNLEEINFYNIESAFNFAIIDCPHLKKIFISNIGIEIPFKTCKYRLGRKSGIVSFVGEKALILWKKRNNNIRFFELIEEDKKKYDLI